MQTESGSLLLDCSADAPHRMAQENLDWPNLEAIWISHLHLDHCGGLAPFLFGVKHAPQTQSRTKPLKIFSCAGVEKLLRSADEALGGKLLKLQFPLELSEIAGDKADETVETLPGITANFLKTPHRPESLAIKLTDRSGTTLVYTSDTGFAEELAEFARGADLLILECSFYRNKPVATHLELKDAMRIAELAEPRRVLLTHLYPEWDGIDLEAEAKKLWPGETIAARDGLRVEIARA
ncbi:MAG TPA: ribonuclease Z [Pyrinomonadaceae bacterium]|nr:ribonuclease Z [Pyrinomonadaceae bacterium]